MATHGFYYERKRLHLCVWCGKQDARTLTGKIYCFECNEKRREYFKKHYSIPDVAERTRKYRIERKRKLLEQGLCTNCGKRKIVPGKTVCPVCMAKNKSRSARYRKEKKSYEEL